MKYIRLVQVAYYASSSWYLVHFDGRVIVCTWQKYLTSLPRVGAWIRHDIKRMKRSICTGALKQIPCVTGCRLHQTLSAEAEPTDMHRRRANDAFKGEQQ